MAERVRPPSVSWSYSAEMLRFVLGVLLTTAALALAGPFIEGRDRSAEIAVRSYTEAVRTGDARAALATLQPSARDLWRIFVEHQAGDRIQILSMSVERVSLLDDSSKWGAARSVTINAELEGKGGERWRASSLVPGQMEGSRWMLSRPPFGPDEPWLVPPEPE